MYFHKGFLVIDVPGAIPIWIHWTTVILAIVVSDFRFRPGAWLAALLVILIHELGHAIFVLKAKATVEAIHTHAMGGHCIWAGDVTRTQRLAIVWGGVLAQFLLLGIAYPVSIYLGPLQPGLLNDFLTVLLRWNLIIALFNLLPIPPLDGSKAWKLLRLVLQDWRHQRRRLRRKRRYEKLVKKHVKNPPQ